MALIGAALARNGSGVCVPSTCGAAVDAVGLYPHSRQHVTAGVRPQTSGHAVYCHLKVEHSASIGTFHNVLVRMKVHELWIGIRIEAARTFELRDIRTVGIDPELVPSQRSVLEFSQMVLLLPRLTPLASQSERGIVAEKLGASF